MNKLNKKILVVVEKLIIDDVAATDYFKFSTENLVLDNIIKNHKKLDIELTSDHSMLDYFKYLARNAVGHKSIFGFHVFDNVKINKISTITKNDLFTSIIEIEISGLDYIGGKPSKIMNSKKINAILNGKFALSEDDKIENILISSFSIKD